MVCIGSGGAFNGLTYWEGGRMRTARDFILDRLPIVQVNQWIAEFHSMPKGMNGGVACRRITGESAAENVV